MKADYYLIRGNMPYVLQEEFIKAGHTISMAFLIGIQHRCLSGFTSVSTNTYCRVRGYGMDRNEPDLQVG